jgi:formate hydrogenlyase transcriptional activator
MTVAHSDDTLRLSATVRDLLALSIIPEQWVGREPPAIVADLADLLIGSLGLDFAFVRLCDPRGSQVVEETRGDSWKAFPEWLQRHLAASGQVSRKEVVANAGVEKPCHGILIPIGVNSERGLVAAASHRHGFPDQIDQQLLSVAANSAATAFQNAFLINELRSAQEALLNNEQDLRKARDELEIKVAERTAELARSERELRNDIEERKQAEFYLAEGQRLAHMGSWAFKAAGFDYWSSELFQIHGLDPSGKPPTVEEYLALVHPEDREFMKQAIEKILADHREFDFTKRIVRPDGKIRTVRCVGVPAIEGETFQGFVGTGMDVTEQEELAQDLRRGKAHLTNAQTLSHTGSVGMEVRTKRIFWSEESARIYGYAPGTEPTSDLILQRVHPDDVNLLKDVLKRAAQGGANFDFEHRLRMPDGSVKFIYNLSQSMKDEDGNEEVVGAIVDITERRRAEEALRQSEERFRLVVESIPGLVVTTTWEGELEFVNRRAVDYFGRTFEQLKGWRTSDAVHPDDLASAIAVWRDSIEKGISYDVDHRLRRSDGVYRWFHVCGRPLRDAQGLIVRWYALLTDIDDRKKAEQKLEEQEMELRQVLDFAPQLIAVFGPRREPLFTNRTALDYFGLTLDEWRGKNPRCALGHPDDSERLQDQWDRAMSSGAAFEIEVRLRKGDGSYRWFLSRYNTVRDHEGQVLRWYVACTDIEDRKRIEEKLHQENVALREEIDRASMFEEIVGTSPALQTVLSRISKVAPTDSTVLITGETGTGKELVARAIHRRSKRASRAFVSVNCAAIPRDLIASELFGHEKGAFTGAMQRRIGRFELAEGGTIFLDEVGELTVDTQIALLRVLQEREFERLGGRQSIHVDVRIIAATNRDLQAAVANGTFREDLYYRLNVFPLEVPPLRDRREDIPLLVEYFLDRYARKAGKNIRSFDQKTLQLLQSYPWPGNIRELQNVIERSVIVCETEIFSVDESWLSQQTRDQKSDGKLYLSQKVAATEKEVIEEALRESQGRVFGPSGAAAKLGIARSTLDSKIRSLNIDRYSFKPRS